MDGPMKVIFSFKLNLRDTVGEFNDELIGTSSTYDELELN
jgi:hypothetical protein